MATKNEDQTKYSHLSKVLENVKKNPKQNIENFECFGVKFVKIYPEMTSQ
jgi:hypothetical protein